MTETLLSILCAKWMWDPNKWCTAKFKSDNTGEVMRSDAFRVLHY